MNYEISREAFKQRLTSRLNFIFIDLLSAEKTPAKFENVVNINYDAEFKNQFGGQFPNKNQNVVLFSLQKGDDSPAKAAKDLKDSGYNFVYFYSGTPEDTILTQI